MKDFAFRKSMYNIDKDYEDDDYSQAVKGQRSCRKIDVLLKLQILKELFLLFLCLTKRL